jgi:Circadian oscillating protein COP23
MKPIVTNQIFRICVATISTIFISQQAQAQLPNIVDTTAPVTSTETPTSPNVAAVSKLAVNCQDLKTVVKKDDQQAVMITWNTNYFGKEFTNSKRCQIVSERLQKAANQNGGTFKGLDLAVGIVNAQTVICTLPSNGEKCDRNNMLFTLKPENSSNPEAVIEQILSFAADGSGSVQEGFRSRSKRVDLSLGNWERKAFKPKKALTTNPKRIKTGF